MGFSPGRGCDRISRGPGQDSGGRSGHMAALWPLLRSIPAAGLLSAQAAELPLFLFQRPCCGKSQDLSSRAESVLMGSPAPARHPLRPGPATPAGQGEPRHSRPGPGPVSVPTRGQKKDSFSWACPSLKCEFQGAGSGFLNGLTGCQFSELASCWFC